MTPDTTRRETDYRRLSNRCPTCGHRIMMHVGSACAVVNGDPHDRKVEHPCKCPKVVPNA